MNLVTFAKELNSDATNAEFVSKLKQAVDLDQLKNLTEEEAQNFFDAAQFLTDYMLLVKEFLGQSRAESEHPYIVYNGPFIENQLTRKAGKKPDFSYLETYGIED